VGLRDPGGRQAYSRSRHAVESILSCFPSLLLLVRVLTYVLLPPEPPNCFLLITSLSTDCTDAQTSGETLVICLFVMMRPSGLVRYHYLYLRSPTASMLHFCCLPYTEAHALRKEPLRDGNWLMRMIAAISKSTLLIPRKQNSLVARIIHVKRPVCRQHSQQYRFFQPLHMTYSSYLQFDFSRS
jgi:hypothetical protein